MVREHDLFLGTEHIVRLDSRVVGGECKLKLITMTWKGVGQGFTDANL